MMMITCFELGVSYKEMPYEKLEPYILFERKQNDATGFPSESHDRKLFLHYKKFHSILRLTRKKYAMSFVN